MSDKEHKSVIQIKHPRIIEFYKKNTQIDIEKINLLYIDLLENIINVSLDTPSVVNKIMSALGSQNRDLNNLLSVVTSSSEIHKNELSNMKNIYSLSSDNIQLKQSSKFKIKSKKIKEITS